MIEGAEARAWIAEIGGEIGQPSRDGAAAVDNLVGIGKVKLGAMSDARGMQREFPAADQGLFNREGKEKVGFSDGVVVEEIPGAGAEGVGVERPSAKGDGDTELMLFVALAIERNEFATICRAQLLQRSGGSKQRRRLIVVTVEGAEGPAKTGDRDRCTEARADGVLRNTAAGKICGADAGGKSQPGERFEFFVEEKSREAAGRRLTIRKGCLAGIASPGNWGRRWSGS